jgi:hypothetical protein
MNRNSHSKQFPFRRIFIYVVMTLAVVAVVPLITLFMLGYRLNTGKIEQYAFLQFNSSPSGATISVDGGIIGSKTPTKNSVPSGKHAVVMWRSGYEKWQKTVDTKSGALTWLNYALLVPKDLTVKSVVNYASVHTSLASSKGDYMLIQPQSDKPKFDLIDISSDTIKQTDLILPASLYTQAADSTFRLEKWSDNERYALVSHKYGSVTEWIIVDTQNLAQSKNVTKLFNLVLTDVTFADDSGNTLYALDGGDIRKLDLGAATISRPLVSNVTSYSVYIKSKVITYVGVSDAHKDQRVAGIYRNGDASPYVMKTVSGNSSIPLNIATSNYFNDNYIVMSYGKEVEILSGSYPNTTSDNANNMKKVESFKSKVDINNLSFSPTGKYVFVQSGAYFASYDLEYLNLVESSLSGSGNVSPVKWLDENHVWTDRNGKLTVYEFDGANAHMINPVVEGQDATLTNNGRFLYSIGVSKSGYQLQRVRMILP